MRIYVFSHIYIDDDYVPVPALRNNNNNTRMKHNCFDKIKKKKKFRLFFQHFAT